MAYSRTPKNMEGVAFTDLDTLLSTCDIVSLHIPQNTGTIGMIGKAEIAKMKKSAVLINTARGPIVDSRTLADALNSGTIAGAGIDVFETEPPIERDHPLLHAKNCIAAPPRSFCHKEAMYKRAAIVCGNIRAYLAGSPQNLV
jgi:phosphoglycerate dehydrogenase-like enzyme